MMTLSRRALVLILGLAIPALSLAASPQETPPPAETGPPPVSLSLADAVQMSLKNNLDIRVTSYTPQIREQDIIFQEAVFDPNVSAFVEYQDQSQPARNRFDVGASGAGASVDSTSTTYSLGLFDRFHWGGSYSADFVLASTDSTSANAVFPTVYFSSLTFAYNQSLLRNLGSKVNETRIVIARNNQSISRSQFRQQVLDTLKATEDAYWELTFARQDLEVKNESLRLAQELLKLNKIKVQVGTLPPIEITTAEAEVANREQGVIVAENAVSDAEDTLRRVLNMPKESENWARPITPTDEPAYVERPVELDREMETAIDNRPDLEQARLNVGTADTQLAFDRNQLKWDLSARAAYSFQGLAGDAGALVDPNTGIQLVPRQHESYVDAFDSVHNGDFPTWSVSLALGIPIGNNAAESRYTGSRLSKEQSEISYERARLNAEVQVRTAARAILTSKRRIDAAEKNVELQKKKVEAEQKKFENGMSTSFQVLTFQNDLITALGTKNRAMVDYRKSLTALEQSKGTLNEYLKVDIR